MELDLRGLKCPLPVFYTRKALRGLAPGTTLVVRCSDPLAVVDIPHLVQSEGHRLAAQGADGPSTRFVIVKDDAAAR